MDNYGIQELYDVTLRATDETSILDRELEEGEIIFRFKRIQIANLFTQKSRVTANGGYLNRTWVYWDETQPVRFNLQQGVASKYGLSLINNDYLCQREKDIIPMTEEIESVITDEDTFTVTLKKTPSLEHPYFLYANGDTMVDKTKYTIKDNTIVIEKDNEVAFYLFDYYTILDSELLRIGQNCIGGFLRLEGKTRLKDDIEGQEKTGIIVIPKLRIMSDLSMRLGDQATPLVYAFTVEGQPVGTRHHSRVCEMHFLDEDLDADL